MSKRTENRMMTSSENPAQLCEYQTLVFHLSKPRGKTKVWSSHSCAGFSRTMSSFCSLYPRTQRLSWILVCNTCRRVHSISMYRTIFHYRLYRQAMLCQGKGCQSVTAHLLVIRQRFSAKKEIQNPKYCQWSVRSMSDTTSVRGELWAET